VGVEPWLQEIIEAAAGTETVKCKDISAPGTLRNMQGYHSLSFNEQSLKIGPVIPAFLPGVFTQFEVLAADHSRQRVILPINSSAQDCVPADVQELRGGSKGKPDRPWRLMIHIHFSSRTLVVCKTSISRGLEIEAAKGRGAVCAWRSQVSANPGRGFTPLTKEARNVFLLIITLYVHFFVLQDNFASSLHIYAVLHPDL